MQEASLESVIKTILIIMLIYFGFKILIRFFGPMILKYFLKKIGKKFTQQFNQPPSSGKRKEGDVVIEKRPKGKQGGSNKNVGEYIDYEEID